MRFLLHVAKISLFCMIAFFNLAEAETRVVGYIPSYRSMWLNRMDLSAVTHVNLANLRAGDDGKFSYDSVIPEMIRYCKTKDVRVFITLQNSDKMLELMETKYAEATAQEIVRIVLELGVDGLDVDLESNMLTEGCCYNSFIATLSKTLRSKGPHLGFTGALQKWVAPKITDETLALYDWLNLMAYDYKGPWDTNPPLQHSPYEAVEQELKYYTVERRIPANKLCVGVPFYGYDFSDPNHVTSFAWVDLLKDHPSAMNEDSVDGMYYNGLKTIRAKAQKIIMSGAGIMIWELGQDVFLEQTQFSLLQQIKSVVHPYYRQPACVKGCPSGGVCDPSSGGVCTVYDNGYHCDMGDQPCPSSESCFKWSDHWYYHSTKCTEFKHPLLAGSTGDASLQSGASTNATLLAFTGLALPSETYTKMDEVSCRKIKIEKNGVKKSYRTRSFAKAKAYCDELGEDCVGILDRGCDGRGKYNLCKRSNKPVKSKPGHCIHLKEN